MFRATDVAVRRAMPVATDLEVDRATQVATDLEVLVVPWFPDRRVSIVECRSSSVER
jgi:hypothetical protein